MGRMRLWREGLRQEAREEGKGERESALHIILTEHAYNVY